MASLQVDERGHHARTMRIPIVNDFLSVEEEAGAAVGVDPEAIIAIDLRDEIAGPAHGVISGRQAGSRTRAAHLQRDPEQANFSSIPGGDA